MVDGDTLAQLLSDFARTMGTDFPLEGVLDDLVERIVDILPVTGAGVTLMQAGATPRYLAASNEDTLGFERLQTELGEGPCGTVVATGHALAVPDLIADRRYPHFGPAASAAGVAAVFAFPLRHGDDCLGALDLYRDADGPLSAPAAAAAQTMADIAAAYVLQATSRSESIHTEDWFRDRSLQDALTGLPNGRLLHERIEQAARRSRGARTGLAVISVDLDHFKRVNDAFGHRTGDQLLVAVSGRLAAVANPGDTLARVSGDEFVFLCADLSGPGDIDLLVSRIGDAFTAPFAGPGRELTVTASLGVAYCGPGEPYDRLVLDANIAMYQAKRRGGATHQVIDLHLAAEAHDRDQLERDLRAALAGRHLDVAYQPIVRIADGSVTGVEALLRWSRPAKGPVPASMAIAVAEQCGLIAGVGAWVLNRSCHDWMAWCREHPGRRLDLAVNVSAQQLMTAGFASSVAEVLTATGMDPAALVLEVTEASFVEDGERAIAVLGDLKSLGIRLALDDFGTGYSSLTTLRRLPVDIVKIDRSFVAEMGRDPAASTMAAAVTRLAHDLGRTVTAEGVETAAQCDEVVSVGCETAQGYFFARAMTAADFSAQLN